MRKIRLGNDFILKLVLYKVDDQLVLNNEGDPISGTPEDLTLASNLILKIYNIKYRKEYRLNTSVNINIISSEILLNIQQTGLHYIVLEYDLTNPEFLNGLLHFKVGLYAFEILSSVSDAELVDQIIIGSCVSTGGESGKSAYEIAVENGFVGTELEWLDSLSPNTDNFATKTELSLKANLTDIPSLVGYATETYVSNSIINKVDKVIGKGLSTNDYTTLEKDKLFGISNNANNYVHPATHSADIIVDGITNKAYTATEKTKLDGIATGADVSVNSDWNAVSGKAQILNKPNLDAIVPISKGGTGLTVIGSPNQILKVNSGGTALEYATTSESSSGTVTSIAVSAPIGFSVSGSPITTFGTIAISLTEGYSIPTIIKQSNWDSAYSWGNHSGLYRLISYVPSWSEVSNKPTTLGGYGITDAQPFDSDLTAISSISGNSGLLKKTAVDTWSLDTSTYLTGITKSQVEEVLVGNITSHTHSYQPIDDDLTSISSLVGVSGLLKKTALNTWSLDSSTYLTSITKSLVEEVLTGSITSHTHNYLVTNNNLTAISGLIGTGLLKKTGVDIWELDSSSYLTSNLTITVSGDASGSGTSSINITLNTVPVSKGGTGLTSLGTSLLVLRVNTDATGLEWATDAGGLTFLGLQYGVVYADTSVSISSTSPGTSGYLLKSNLTSAPSWIDPSTLIVGSAVKFYSDTITGTGSYFIPFLDNAENGYTDCKKSSNFYYSPSTQKLTAGYYAGTWNGATISTAYGGTGLTSIGSSNKYLKVKSDGTGLEYSTGYYLNGNAYGVVYVTIPNSGGNSSLATTSVGTAGQYLKSNGSGAAPTWDTFRDKGINSVTTLVSLPVNKRLVVATLSAATTLSLASGLEVGDELHIFANNTTGSPFVQTLPNTGSFTSLSGTSITIPAYGVVEINLLCIQTNNYFLRAV